MALSTARLIEVYHKERSLRWTLLFKIKTIFNIKPQSLAGGGPLSQTATGGVTVLHASFFSAITCLIVHRPGALAAQS